MLLLQFLKYFNDHNYITFAIMLQEYKVNINGSKISYYKSGLGEKVVITFHGFGQSGKSFQAFEKALPGYQFYHINLFFHENSYLHPHHRPLSAQHWVELFIAFLTHEKIHFFSLAGFSIGCRLIYNISQKLAHRVKNIILLAPEGKNYSKWYRISVSLFPGLFKYFIFNAGIFFSILGFLKKLRIIDTITAKFACTQMMSRKQRWQVYMTWMNFRLLKPDFNHWFSTMNQNNVTISIFVGKQDKIIPSGNAMFMNERLNKVTLQYMSAGHFNLIKKSAAFYAQNSKM